MYYYSKNNRNKIVHFKECFHIQHTELDSIGWFETLFEAYEQGYRLCKCCSPLVKQYKREENEILDFCRRKGLSVYLDNMFITIYSIRSKWKIALDKNNRIILYHKNDFTTAKDHLSKISGYHLQGDAQRNSIVDYLQYIVDHDHFRMLNPVYIPKQDNETVPPRKGTKRYRSAQRKIKKIEHKKAIRNVLSLIESLNVPSA